MIRGNGDTSFLLDLAEGEETSSAAHNNNFQSSYLMQILQSFGGDDMDGLDAEGLLVQGPPSVVRMRSLRPKGFHAGRQSVAQPCYTDSLRLQSHTEVRQVLSVRKIRAGRDPVVKR